MNEIYNIQSSDSGMKVALFGGTGFVGSYIIKKLISEDFIPTVLVREESSSKITSSLIKLLLSVNIRLTSPGTNADIKMLPFHIGNILPL